MSQYFPKPYEPFGGDINVNVYSSYYATKVDLRNATWIDTSKLVAKSNLVSLKAEVDKLDIDKLVPVPVDLSKLSYVAKNDVVKKDCVWQLVAKVNNIDTSRFMLKIKYDIDKSELEKKIPNTNRLVKKTDCNAKISEIEGKIRSTCGLAANSALTALKLKNKTKQLTDHNHDKHITTPEFNMFTADVFDARLAGENLVRKTDFDTKLTSLN